MSASTERERFMYALAGVWVDGLAPSSENQMRASGSVVLPIARHAFERFAAHAERHGFMRDVHIDYDAKEPTSLNWGTPGYPFEWDGKCPLPSDLMVMILAVYAPEREWRIEHGNDEARVGFGSTILLDPFVVGRNHSLRVRGPESLVVAIARKGN